MKSTLLKDNIPFRSWKFVDQHGRDDDHWYIRLAGGEYMMSFIDIPILNLMMRLSL